MATGHVTTDLSDDRRAILIRAKSDYHNDEVVLGKPIPEVGWRSCRPVSEFDYGALLSAELIEDRLNADVDDWEYRITPAGRDALAHRAAVIHEHLAHESEVEACKAIRDGFLKLQAAMSRISQLSAFDGKQLRAIAKDALEDDMVTRVNIPLTSREQALTGDVNIDGSTNDGRIAGYMGALYASRQEREHLQRKVETVTAELAKVNKRFEWYETEYPKIVEFSTKLIRDDALKGSRLADIEEQLRAARWFIHTHTTDARPYQVEKPDSEETK